MSGPLVSCLMPTAGRRRYVVRALSCFLQQSYPSTELVVLDNGLPRVDDLMPRGGGIRYEQVEPGRHTLGELRNMTVELARGDLLALWDNDDWYGPRRLEQQLDALLASRDAVACAYGPRAFVAVEPTDELWIWQLGAREFFDGSTLMHRHAWQLCEHRQVGAMTWLLRRLPKAQIVQLRDLSQYLYQIHSEDGGNNSGVRPRPGSESWTKLDGLTGEDVTSERVRVAVVPELRRRGNPFFP
jgi:hypothetical protein